MIRTMFTQTHKHARTNARTRTRHDTHWFLKDVQFYFLSKVPTLVKMRLLKA